MYLQTQGYKRKRSADALLPRVQHIGGEVIELPNGQFALRVPITKPSQERMVRRQLPDFVLTEVDEDFLSTEAK